MTSPLTAVVLGAGMGTRMKSRLPKVAHTVAGQPMIAYPVAAARDAGAERVIVVVGHRADAVRAALDGGVETVEQAPQLGSADALAKAVPLIAEGNVLVLNGDLPLIQAPGVVRLVETHAASSAAISFATVHVADPAGYGRVLRDHRGHPTEIIEEDHANEAQRLVKEVNGGLYCVRVDWLRGALARVPMSPKGEHYLTELVALAVADGLPVFTVEFPDADELMGVNDRVQLAAAESVLRDRVRRAHMLAGVTIVDPATTYIDSSVRIGRDTVIRPNTFIQSGTTIGEECEIGPGSIIRASVVGDRCRILYSVVEDSELSAGVGMGPWSRVRGGAFLDEAVDLGNYAEIKKSRVGRRTKMHHFGYLGDAELGEDVNVGAGTITCNYDGVRKNRTIVGDRVFIGSDTMLVAPVELGAGSATGAGAVVTKDVPPDTLAVGVPARHLRRKGVEGSPDEG